MKRLVTALIAFVLTFLMMCIGITAQEQTGNVYEIDEVTVIFDQDSVFSIDEQRQIAEMLANPETAVSPAGLTCTLFGHKYTTESVTTITHCVNATDPRCLTEYFLISVCSRCGDEVVERTGYHYISCCP